MTLVPANQNRNTTIDITFKDSDDVVVTPTESDVIVATILRVGSAAVLTVASNAPTANGSTFTKGATNRLRLDAADMTFDPGSYTLLADMYDASDGNDLKLVARQVLYMEGV